jgi:hypothetical protein
LPLPFCLASGGIVGTGPTQTVATIAGASVSAGSTTRLSRLWATIARAPESSRMCTSASVFVVGLTTTNTPPAFSVANTATTTSAEFSPMIATRSPRRTPAACSVEASPSLARSTAANEWVSPPATSAALSGCRPAASTR